MKLKHLVLITFLVILTTIGFVNASSDNMTDDELSFSEDTSIDSINNEENDISDSDDTNNTGTLSDLNNLIKNAHENSEINLDKDYIYNKKIDYAISGLIPQGDYFLVNKKSQGILIDKAIIINGNGHIIDGKNETRIFNITANNVILKNITFINGNSNIDFGIIINIPTFTSIPNEYNAVAYKSGKFYDTYYKNSDLYYNGGAIYCSGNNLKITNCSFINNNAKGGGAIFNAGKNTIVLNSQFYQNHAKYKGNSICSMNDINIQTCNFTNDGDENIIFCAGNWKVDDMNSTYFNSYVKFGYIDFEINLTHLYEDYYNLNIKFKLSSNLSEDSHDYSKNKIFCLKIDNNNYTLETNEKSQAILKLKLGNAIHFIEVYNQLTELNLKKSFLVYESPLSNNMNNPHDDSNIGNFTDLKVLIENSKEYSEINLYKDYTKNKLEKDYGNYEVYAIKINKSIKINGNGHVIDGNNSLIFELSRDGINVIFENIIFKNGRGYYASVIDDRWRNTISVVNCKFINGRDSSFIYTSENLFVLNSMFCNNTSGSSAIYCYNTLNVFNSTFTNNSGSGIYNMNAPHVINSTFIDNKRPHIWTDNIEFIINNKFYNSGFAGLFINTTKHNSIININKNLIATQTVLINGNNVTINGNGHEINGQKCSEIFYIMGKNVTLKNINFKNGHICSHVESNINIINCSFRNNNGNAISIKSYSNITILNSAFINNTGTKGSAITMGNGCNVFIINSYFIDNIGKNNSIYYGPNPLKDYGAISSFFSNVYILNSTFINNTATRGSAISSYRDHVHIINSNFINNNAGAKHGAIFSEYGEITITNCNFNSKAKNGSISSENSNITIISSKFNKAENIMIFGKVTLVNCYFEYNYEDKLINSISLLLKPVKVKKSTKKLVLQAVLKQNNKILSGKIIIFKFNGKKYIAKTNKKGVGKVIITKKVLKKLKVGKKVKYQVIYGETTIKKSAKVRK